RLPDHTVLPEGKKRLGRAISHSFRPTGLAHHFAKMSQWSTFRRGAVAEGGATTLVFDLRKGAARRALAAKWGGSSMWVFNQKRGGQVAQSLNHLFHHLP